MRADYSRDTFRPTRHYSSVRLQQGRVVTDADWNEQADITRRRAEREAADVIGPCGAPEATAGFAVSAATQALGVFATGTDAWVVGEDGLIVSTLDEGTTWTVDESLTTVALRAVHFAAPPNAETGWAVGDAGTILATTDGGTSWMWRPASSTVALHDVFAVGATLAWAVGDGGTVLRTTDGGTTWTAVTVGTGRLYAVRFVDASRGWVAGQGGRIAATTDGGATWTPQNSQTSAHLRALHFADPSTNPPTGWAVGDAGTILKTTDGGTTWTRQTSPVTSCLRSIAFTGTTVGWAVGDDGVALRTTNGGVTWATVDLGIQVILRCVALASTTLGWIVGDDSVAVRVGSQPLAVSLRQLPLASLSLGPGRLYVDGVLCELEARSSFCAQPNRRVVERLPVGTHLIYLDVWQRHVSHLEDPAIREVALGGPDTAGRGQTVWQARALPADVTSPPPNCLTDFPEMDELAASPKPWLRARSEPAQIATSVCEIGASAGFRRLENQLYRVEVHAGGVAPAFKWSRENGSVAYAIVSITEDPAKSETVVKLASRGLDENLDLGVGDWVEIVDDDATLEHGAGLLVEYLREGDDPREIVVQGIVPTTIGRDPGRHPLLRRWEQKPASGAPGTLPIDEGKWINLEEGVQVWFAPGGTYRPGDYWMIPARTITGDVEWPRDEHGEPLARRADGIEHRYCRLAIIEVTADGTITIVSDCRNLFPPITELDLLLYVSGDGQDGVPGVELPQPLVVRVARGQHPVKGATVLFEIENDQGTGSLRSLDGRSGRTLEVTTLEDGEDIGTAACKWSLDTDPGPGPREQRVRVSLRDAASRAMPGQIVRFCASATATLYYVSGDGQEARPGHRVPHPLRVRILNGRRPVIGARVEFSVESGGGTLDAGSPFTSRIPDGIAECPGWTLGASGTQRVLAKLLDASGVPIPGQVLGFNTTLSVASEIAYRPVCALLQGKTTVQDAVEMLCESLPTIPELPHRIFVRRILAGGQPLDSDIDVTGVELAKNGIAIELTERLPNAVFHRLESERNFLNGPVTVTVALPHPIKLDVGVLPNLIGTVELELEASAQVDVQKPNFILWSPKGHALVWLRDMASKFMTDFKWARMRATLRLRGGAVGDPEGKVRLDGYVRSSTDNAGRTRYLYKSGETLSAWSDLEVWFWLVP